MRPALPVLLSVLFGLAAPVSGADRFPPRVCRGIVAMLHAGVGNSSEHKIGRSLLETLEHNSHGRLSVAPWQSNGPQWAFDLRSTGNVPPQNGGSGFAMIRTAALKADRLVAVMATDGSASCMDVSLYWSIGRRLLQAVSPYVTRNLSCARFGDWVSLASLDGMPFVARETREHTTLQLAGWNGQGWNPVCSIVVRYVPQLVSEGAFCRLSDCTRAEDEARRIARQVQAEGNEDPSYQKGSDPRLDRLLELADHTPDMEAYTVPASPGWLDANSVARQSMPYEVMLDGRPTLALAGVWRESPPAESEPVGYAVGFLQQAGDRLTSVAGFHLLTARSTVRSVLVTH